MWVDSTALCQWSWAAKIFEKIYTISTKGTIKLLFKAVVIPSEIPGVSENVSLFVTVVYFVFSVISVSVPIVMDG